MDQIIKTLKYEKVFIAISFVLLSCINSMAGEKYNFNSGWRLSVGDTPQAKEIRFADNHWKRVTLPHAFNEDEAFKVQIAKMSDSIAWYRKHFRLPSSAKGKKVFIEFEGVRQAAEIYVNGKHVGLNENGVMAFGFDLTPYIKYNGDNVIAVRTDNNWRYKEKGTGSGFQWNDHNFNANYGGIPKNVWLHITGKIYQTLPLYSNLKTTGVYIYASDMKVRSHEAIIHAESQIKNESGKKSLVSLQVEIYDYDGEQVAKFNGEEQWIKADGQAVLKAKALVKDLHFWSWGYGYLYNVKTKLLVDNRVVDEVTTRTGFRKTRFGEGKVWLNDRVIQLKGYAQRSSNEWPGVGMSVPAWLSDYSNGLMMEGNGNLYRWMHVTPWKQDIESCDRTGVIQMMPAGDAERDVTGRRWEQRIELMRDAIIYNRNNPSILFYESGNESISREHMLEMRAIRDQYDPHGGRAIGSREMLDIREAEYGGEMLYVNKSAHSPMIQTEYCRDEGYRKYWDEYSYPFHKEGDGPLVKGKPADAYNHNQDQLAVEFIRRWYDLWRERPGTGRRVNSGGAKIVFSDTQTHGRSEMNYRVSGVVDPMRIPKDAFFAHKVMWDGWVDIENDNTYIIGHWNYSPTTVKPVYVVSTGEKVELLVNGKSKGFGRHSDGFLFTFDSVRWEKGKIEAIAYNNKNKEESRYSITTARKPKKLKMTLIQGPNGTFADGADVALVQVEVVDEKGQRCPLANDMIEYELDGMAEWRGGLAQGKDNFVLSRELPVEAGINRVMLRSTDKAGKVRLKASAKGLEDAEITFVTKPVQVSGGLSTYMPSDNLPSRFDRGETPETPSFTSKVEDVQIDSVVAGTNQQDAYKSFDDNELSEWKNDGKASTAWITYKLTRRAEIDDICLKLTGWRQRSYPLEVFAGDSLIWKGNTPKSLGYVHLYIDNPVMSDRITIRLKGVAHDSDGFGQIIEVVEAKAGELDLLKTPNGEKTNNELRIVEIEFREKLNR